LAIGVGAVQALPQSLCQTFWEYEFEVPDFNKFSDLARAERPVADLHASTGGRPERSARFREFRDIIGLDAELRATFPAGGRAWGLVQLNRDAAFGEDELALVEQVAPRVGRAVRTALLTHPADRPSLRGPGLVLLDEQHALISANPEAAAWFAELECLDLPFETALGIDIPETVVFTAIEARVLASTAPAGEVHPVRTRLRARNGGWLLAEASCLRDAGGALGPTAVVIQPAKASEIAPLIVQAYELTPREVQVTRALARGLSTPEIAAELHLSRYTVQDHLKAVYEKIGVSSRGELVAKMFADHHNPALDVAITASSLHA
ncbi:MAG: helix-turn-helix transcriptional regulator, partial [Solirubrobacteraceae bacterium]|nr:helix-turn-helix transcriptional regulator [Solirubrobacteraceae bacterium]